MEPYKTHSVTFILSFFTFGNVKNEKYMQLPQWSGSLVRNLNVRLMVCILQLAQLERAHSRLQCELEHNKEANQAQERLRETGLQVEQLQEQKDWLATELSSLQTTHDALRSFQLVRECAFRKASRSLG